MMVVIFELEPKAGQQQPYFDAARALREELDGVDGFISVERFQSLSNPDRYVSLSFWRDEDAVKRWRNHSLHRQVQSKGRNEIFTHYRLRVAEVVRDYSMSDREQVPQDG